jgi:hypothetical protein
MTPFKNLVEKVPLKKDSDILQKMHSFSILQKQNLQLEKYQRCRRTEVNIRICESELLSNE